MNRPFPGSDGPYNSRVSPADTGRDGRNRLRRLIGKCVRINLVGDETIEGRFIAFCRDYIVLKTKDGVVYVNADQVESIEENGADRSGGQRPPFIRAANFRDLVEQFEDEFVKIKWGRRDKVKGFVTDVSGNIMTVVDNNRMIQIFIDKIKAIQPLSDRERLGHRSGCNRTEGSRTRGDRTGGSRTQGNRTGGVEVTLPGVVSPEAVFPLGSDGNRTGGNRTGSGNHRTGGDDIHWMLGNNLLPEPTFRPNRYGVPESLLLASAKRKKKSSSKPKRKS